MKLSLLFMAFLFSVLAIGARMTGDKQEAIYWMTWTIAIILLAGQA